MKKYANKLEMKDGNKLEIKKTWKQVKDEVQGLLYVQQN